MWLGSTPDWMAYKRPFSVSNSKHLPRYICRSARSRGKRYDRMLQDVKGITIPKRIENSTHVFHQYTIRVEASQTRCDARAHLKSKGIPTGVYYPIPGHAQKAFKPSLIAISGFTKVRVQHLKCCLCPCTPN
jgi:dTDP-4-amino-4,6-dideoxygalactose transaminase